jgi:voltage-gated potassium channel
LRAFARISRASRYNSGAIVTEASKGGRWFRFQGPAFATVLLISIVAAGTIGYMLIEGWSAWDAFYMTVITVTTVGYREVHDLSWTGQAFTVLLLVSGVGAALYCFTLLAAIVVEGGLPKRLQRRRAVRMLETIKDHFIICGYGRIGSLVAAQFRRQRVPYVVVERNPQRHQLAIEEGGLAVEGDASREDVLKRVGIDRARGLIAAVSTDADNVYTVLSARVLRPDLLIIGRAENDDAADKLKHAGANRVISPYHIGAVQMAQTALRPAVVDFIALATSSDSVELALEEIAVAPASALAGQSLLEANLRHRFSVIVIGIQRPDGTMEFNPEPDISINSGDKLVVLGRQDSMKLLESEATAGGSPGPVK